MGLEHQARRRAVRSPLQRITAAGQNSAGDAVSMTTNLAVWLRIEDAACDAAG